MRRRDLLDLACSWGATVLSPELSATEGSTACQAWLPGMLVFTINSTMGPSYEGACLLQVPLCEHGPGGQGGAVQSIQKHT
jgi:hypothetical protein